MDSLVLNVTLQSAFLTSTPLKARRITGRVTHGMPDITVSQIVLNQPRVHAEVC
jgi:hypothetical protein